MKNDWDRAEEDEAEEESRREDNRSGGSLLILTFPCIHGDKKVQWAWRTKSSP